MKFREKKKEILCKFFETQKYASTKILSYSLAFDFSYLPKNTVSSFVFFLFLTKNTNEKIDKIEAPNR